VKRKEKINCITPPPHHHHNLFISVKVDLQFDTSLFQNFKTIQEIMVLNASRHNNFNCTKINSRTEYWRPHIRWPVHKMFSAEDSHALPFLREAAHSKVAALTARPVLHAAPSH